MSSQSAETCGSGKASEGNTGYKKPRHLGPSGIIWVICREYMCQPILHIEDKSCDWKLSDSFPNTSWPWTNLLWTGERHSFFGVRDKLISLFNIMSTKAKANPLYQETTNSAENGTLLDWGEEVGNIHL